MNEKTDSSFHAYIRGIILLGFTFLILGLLITDNIKYYLAPKMVPFIYFSFFIFLLLGITQIIRSLKKEEATTDIDCDCGLDHQITGPTWLKILIYSIFIIPVLMGFVIPDQPLNSSVAANRGIIYSLGQQSSPNPADEEIKTGTPRADQYLNDPEGYLAGLKDNGNEVNTENGFEHSQVESVADEEWLSEYYEKLLNELMTETVIQVNDDNFLDIMSLLDQQLDKFIGKDIETIGFIYREPDFSNNRLVVARFSILCCTADAGVYGMLVETDEAYHYENDLWVKVRGTIHQTEYNGYQLPLMQLREIAIIDEPDSPYVYPSFR